MDMKLNRFYFGLLMGLCPWVISWAFEYADNFRGYNSLGGEMFTLLLPIFVVVWRNWTVEKIKKEKKEMR